MIVVFLPIFVADTKTIFGYNVGAPLMSTLSKEFQIGLLKLEI